MPDIHITGDGNVVGDHSRADIQKDEQEVTVSAAHYDTAKIRALMMEAFSSEEIRTVLFDSFRQVYENTPPSESKSTLIQRLIEYATRHDLLGNLLLILQNMNPQAFAKFPKLLHGP